MPIILIAEVSFILSLAPTHESFRPVELVILFVLELSF